MNYTQLLEEVKRYVGSFFETNANAGFTYHNRAHTEMVVARAGQIARHYELNDEDFFIVSTAAWFHDMGYYTGATVAGHEQRGAELAGVFLQQKGLDEHIITQVKACIMATCIPQKPDSLLEKIVADADLFHFGTDKFAEQNKNMRREAAWRNGGNIDKTEWRHGTIRLLEAHSFKTDYARNLLTPQKNANLEKLKQKNAETAADHTEKDSKIKKQIRVIEPEIVHAKKEKTDRPEKGIETMFRISSSNHQRLSDMADNKAHIMITTTSIIISVLLSVLLRKLEDNPNLVIPTILLLAICVITMVFSILATRPSVPPGTFTPADISDKKVNLLFFGNFYKMSYEDYSNGMQAMMNDREFLYGSLTKDVYSQGVVLGRKYKLLRMGYNIFMFGIVASVIAFVVAVIFISH